MPIRYVIDALLTSSVTRFSEINLKKVFSIYGKILNLLWQHLYDIGQSFAVVSDQILNKN